MSTITLYVMVGQLPTSSPPENVYWGGYAPNFPDYTGAYSGFPGQLINITLAYQQTLNTPAVAGAFTAGGDLTGTNTDQTVTGLQGNAIAATSPVMGQTLIWNGVAWAPANTGSSTTLAGDVTGLASANTVSKIQGVTISGTAANGRVLEATSSTTASWQPPSSDITLAGDVVGVATANEVAKIQGVSISGTPADGYVLAATSSTAATWQAADLSQQVIYAPYSKRPTAGIQGRLFIPSDGPVEFIDAGSIWIPKIHHTVPGINEVAPGNINPFNDGYTSNTSVVTVQGGCISLTTNSSPASGINFQTQDMAYTPGQTVTAWMSTLAMTSGHVGIYLSNALLPSHANFAAFCFAPENGGQQQLNTKNIYYNGSWNDGGGIGPGDPTTTFSNNQLVGLRISGSGSNYNFWYSLDNITWTNVNAVTNMGSYLTPSHCGFFIDPVGTTNYPSATLLGWTVL